jgi:hypothetical protein
VLQVSQPAGEAKVDVPAVQQALIALLGEGAGLAGSAGVHALEEAAFADLMARQGMLAAVP